MQTKNINKIISSFILFSIVFSLVLFSGCVHLQKNSNHIQNDNQKRFINNNIYNNNSENSSNNEDKFVDNINLFSNCDDINDFFSEIVLCEQNNGHQSIYCNDFVNSNDMIFLNYPDNLAKSLGDEISLYNQSLFYADQAITDLKKIKEDCPIEINENYISLETDFLNNVYKFNDIFNKYLNIHLKNIYFIKSFFTHSKVGLISDSKLYGEGYAKFMDFSNIYYAGMYNYKIDVEHNYDREKLDVSDDYNFTKCFNFMNKYFPQDYNKYLKMMGLVGDFDSCLYDNRYSNPVFICDKKFLKDNNVDDYNAFYKKDINFNIFKNNHNNVDWVRSNAQQMLLNFYFSFGPNSPIIKYYTLINDIDDYISIVDKNINKIKEDIKNHIDEINLNKEENINYSIEHKRALKFFGEHDMNYVYSLVCDEYIDKYFKYVDKDTGMGYKLNLFKELKSDLVGKCIKQIDHEINHQKELVKEYEDLERKIKRLK